MTVDAEIPLAFKSVDKLTFWLAAMPESVSPDLTLYEPFDEFELEVFDPVDTEGEAEVPESFKVCPG